jgi:hypothetical protein
MSNQLQQAIAIFKSGNKEDARKLFISFIKKNPHSEPGWKWMYNVSRTNKERIYCLEQILHINPGNVKARQLLDQFIAESTEEDSLITGKTRKSSTVQKRNMSLIFFAAIATIVLVSCLGLAVASARLTSNNAGNNCLFLALNGKQICFSSFQTLPQAADIPVSSATPVDLKNSTIPVTATRPSITFLPTLTRPPSVEGTPTVTNVPINLATSGPDLRLTASFWRKWEIVPGLSLRARAILREALSNPDLDPHTFVKVGDCQMVSGIFLAGYANGKYQLPDGMSETVQWFSESMLDDNITAVNGYGINTVLDPAFGLSAGHNQCLPDETPLDCELRIRRPILVLVGMGTNWIPHGEASFEKHLRETVDKILATGALPILATKADNVEGDWKLNLAIAQVAYDYDLPLVNVWLSVQELPNHGLETPPRQVYLTGDGWMKRNHAWLVTLDKVRQILRQ